MKNSVFQHFFHKKPVKYANSDLRTATPSHHHRFGVVDRAHRTELLTIDLKTHETLEKRHGKPRKAVFSRKTD